MEAMFGLPGASLADIQVFNANNVSASTTQYLQWRKRPGASFVWIMCIGGGGAGGNGVVGANSTAAGGGSGGSGGQSVVTIPAFMLPDTLYVTVGNGGPSPATAGNLSSVSINQSGRTDQDTVCYANGGGAGGNAAGAAAGSAGSAGGAASIATTLVGSGFHNTLIAGMSGVSGGTTGNANGVTAFGNNSGLRVHAGTSGAGLGAAGSAGSNGGILSRGGGSLFSITYPCPNGIGGSSATTPPTNGSNGYAVGPSSLQPFGAIAWYGGTGGGSSHGSATGAGLVGGNGGCGAIGCGGGGGGGALTGSTQGMGGRGGDGLVVIMQW